MGIHFGDKADVEVGGDMVGGDKQILIGLTGDAVYDEVARLISERADLPLPHRTEGVQAVSTIRAEVAKEEPSAGVLENAAATIARIAPGLLTALVDAIPAILQAAPGVLSLLK